MAKTNQVNWLHGILPFAECPLCKKYTMIASIFYIDYVIKPFHCKKCDYIFYVDEKEVANEK